MDRQRADRQQAFVLHRRAFRDSSQIIEVFARDHGRLALVARGVRSRRSRYRGVVQPFAPLQLSWSIRGDLGTLTGAEPSGCPYGLAGDALLAGFYLNELLLRLTHRHDPHPDLFVDYAAALAGLSASPCVEEPLRLFEFRLLRRLGYGVQLQHDIVTGAALDPEGLYRVRPTEGPMAVGSGTAHRAVYSGAVLRAIAREQFDEPAVRQAARRIARAAIDVCLDGRELKSRQVMYEMRGDSRAARRATKDNGQHD